MTNVMEFSPGKEALVGAMFFFSFPLAGLALAGQLKTYGT